jgi:hypothetical protein
MARVLFALLLLCLAGLLTIMVGGVFTPRAIIIGAWMTAPLSIVLLLALAVGIMARVLSPFAWLAARWLRRKRG